MKVFVVLLAGMAMFNSQILISNAQAEEAAPRIGHNLSESPVEAESLCSEQETVAFSCSIEQSAKIVSICYLPDGSSNSRPTMQYRFGVKGKAPELIYPKSPKSIESDFDFSSHRNSSGFSLEMISFSRGSVVYDVTTADKPEYIRWSRFAGIEVTIGDKTTTLITCVPKSVQVNLLPIKKLLSVKEDGHFSDALPKVQFDDSPFPVTHNVTVDSVGAKTEITYPTIRDSNIDKEILTFVDNCNWEDYSRNKGSQCANSVRATIVKGEYLVLHFDSYMYAAGTPHGYGDGSTRIYRKSGQNWKPIKGVDFFVNSDSCRKHINSMIYRRLKPLRLSSLESIESDSDQEPLDLIEEADIYPTSQGIEFAYQQYQLGSYAATPLPTLLSWKNLESCLATK